VTFPATPATDVSGTHKVAEFALRLRWPQVDARTRRQVLRCLLDVVGAAIGGTRTRVARLMAEYVEATYGRGPATVIGRRRGSTAAGAALANGFAASALDVDDGYRPVKGHPGAVVFPAALAAAQEGRASGAEFLAALVVGYEVAMRAGRVLHPLYGFYHGSGAWGPVGAAAAAGRLLGLGQEQLWHALGIAEFHAAITPEMRSVDHPSMLKDGIGWGATVGAAAADLARRGFTGIPSLFDSGGAARPGADDLGRRFLIHDLYFKPYACCRWAHPAIDGALTAARDLGTAAGTITRVRVHTFEAATHLTPTAPRTTEEAQFSVPWPVACALLDGAVGPDQVLEAALRSAVRARLAARVELVVDPDLDARFPEQALAWVEVEARGGRSARSAVMAARGDASAPLSDQELEAKFRSLVVPVLGADGAGALSAAIAELPHAASVDGVAALLPGPAPAARRT
jgi:2-methylcitrate dehydratase PrpD